MVLRDRRDDNLGMALRKVMCCVGLRVLESTMVLQTDHKAVKDFFAVRSNVEDV